MVERKQRLDDLTIKAESAATKSSKAAATATQAVVEVDEPLSRVAPEKG
ncbi:hypothetical protein I9018_10650 [Pseudomonas sp. MPFS]|nr:hypothetical protein [Pseudomonas sp. MPFS]UMZ14116.1 hypothetical protein I9018_10650 [Pseudomonas sp. MPFS]